MADLVFPIRKIKNQMLRFISLQIFFSLKKKKNFASFRLINLNYSLISDDVRYMDYTGSGLESGRIFRGLYSTYSSL